MNDRHEWVQENRIAELEAQVERLLAKNDQLTRWIERNRYPRDVLDMD